jgi:hypothetical protein
MTTEQRADEQELAPNVVVLAGESGAAPFYRKQQTSNQ